MSARRRATRSMSLEYTSAVRARRRAKAPQRASISYHEGSGAMAMVPVDGSAARETGAGRRRSARRQRIDRVGAGIGHALARCAGRGARCDRSRGRGAGAAANGPRRVVPGARRRPVAGGTAAGGGRTWSPHVVWRSRRAAADAVDEGGSALSGAAVCGLRGRAVRRHAARSKAARHPQRDSVDRHGRGERVASAGCVPGRHAGVGVTRGGVS